LRKRWGFDHIALSDASHGWSGMVGENEYADWLRSTGETMIEPGVAHGVDANGWVGRPNYLPEEKTHTFWCTSKAIDFITKRDPTAPFFLNLSYVDPHPPLTPPQFYYDRYINDDLPMPAVGDWVDWFPEEQRGLGVADWRIHINERAMRQARAAYYGMINFVDDQVGRLMNCLRRTGLMQNTFILFTSDHGEMLGDHNMFRKTFAYEGSARVPFIARAPKIWKLPTQNTTNAPVGWQDIMPTLLDAAGIEIPNSVTGKSLLPLMRGEEENAPREVLHGEHAGQYNYNDGVHFLVGSRHKYIWYSQTGQEQLFDLQNDPNELRDLARGEDSGEVVGEWRDRLIEVLKDRPEGFTDGKKLIAGQPHKHMVPGKEG
jgi:arylsulfatase A-like enzyme